MVIILDVSEFYECLLYENKAKRIKKKRKLAVAVKSFFVSCRRKAKKALTVVFAAYRRRTSLNLLSIIENLRERS